MQSNEKLLKKAKPIRLVIFDVDGVLTTGILSYGPDGIEQKNFHVYDGQGMKLLKKSGVDIGIITSCRSAMIKIRMQDLSISHVYQGLSDKLPAYEDLKKKLNLTDEQIAYVGDDLPDLPVLSRVGFAITVPNAPLVIQHHADWITTTPGGKGAAREVCEFIMNAQGTYQSVVDSFMKRPI